MNAWKSKCLALLGGMNSQREVKEQLEVYSLVLEFIGEEFSLRAVQHAVLHEDWRPSPAKLRQIAARIAAPYPTADECYAEIMDKAQNVGLYGRPDPNNPNVLLEGPPPMSHPIVSGIVPYLGGWMMLCQGEAQMQEGLKKQVSSSHATVSAQWEEEVCLQLSLPPSNRNPVYFHAYKPYRAVAPLTENEVLRLPRAHVEEPVNEVRLPKPVRALIECIRLKSAGDGMRAADGLKWNTDEPPTFAGMRDNISSADLRRVEKEVRDHIAAQKAKSGDNWIEVQ